MRALMIRTPLELGIHEVEPQPMGPYDVRIRSVAVGLCGTDLEIFEGLIPEAFVRYPVVIGHEWSGVVEQVGSEVTHVRPGDRVICEGLVFCGRCGACRRGETNLCEQYDQMGFTRYGGGAEVVVAPAQGVHRIPDRLSHEAAVLVEPAATVLRGITRTPMRPGWTAAVVGPGTLGLLAIQFLRAFGASQIIVIGIHDEQLAFARAHGASATVNSLKEDAVAQVKAYTNGRGVDLALETSGSAIAVRTCLDLCRSGGHAVLKGVAGTGANLTLPSDYLMLRDLTVHGIFSYTAQSWANVLQLLDAGLVSFEPFVTHRFPLDQYDRAFDALRRKAGVTVKVVLVHGEGER